MKLWLISQHENNEYDTYDSAVVVAATEDDARHIAPDPEFHMWKDGRWCYSYGDLKPVSGGLHSWTFPEKVKVQLLGQAAEGLKQGDCVCSSFRAG